MKCKCLLQYKIASYLANICSKFTKNILYIYNILYMMPSRTAAPRPCQTPHAITLILQHCLCFCAFCRQNRLLIYSLASVLLRYTSFVTFTMLPVCWLRMTANICNLPIWISAGWGVPWSEADTGSSAQIRSGLWMEGGGTLCPWSGFFGRAWQQRLAASHSYPVSSQHMFSHSPQQYFCGCSCVLHFQSVKGHSHVFLLLFFVCCWFVSF